MRTTIRSLKVGCRALPIALCMAASLSAQALDLVAGLRERGIGDAWDATKAD